VSVEDLEEKLCGIQGVSSVDVVSFVNASEAEIVDKKEKNDSHTVQTVHTDSELSDEKKKHSTVIVNKSSVVLDIAPEDIDVDLDDLENGVTAIQMNGLTWKKFERIDIAYGIKKLRGQCLVVDSLVSVDELVDKLSSMNGVQSVDIFSFVNASEAGGDGNVDKAKKDKGQKKKGNSNTTNSVIKDVSPKSMVLFDVMPSDVDVDMEGLEERVRGVVKEGLIWKGSDIVDVAYGIKKLRIRCQVVDSKVSVDDLSTELSGFDIVQSVDIVSFVNDT